MSELHHVRNIILNLSFDKAFDLCINSISNVKKNKIIKEDIFNGKIEAKAGFTWKTWGDKIEFNLRKLDENCTEVEFSSRPSVSLTLVDYGKNLENVMIIEDFLKKHKKN